MNREGEQSNDGGKLWMCMMRSKTLSSLLLVSLFILSVQSPVLLDDVNNAATNGRSQTTWSGNVNLNDHYTISVTDELVIAACTNVTMSNDVRIYVEGRITVEGTTTCPVYFDYSGTGDHMGIQFNSSSYGRGSKIDNASIVHSTYGITVYSSDPYIANVTIFDPDDVGVDLFNSATPTIRNLIIDEAGKDWIFPAYWRYGIGVSIGAGSAPNIDGLVVSDAVTRGLNIWGNSGGLLRNLSFTNISGATLAQSTGIWVQDSVPLIENALVNRADHGAIIRHIDDGKITRAVMRDLEIKNSMYKALILDKEDKTNYTNYQSAVIEGLEISGTGGPDSKTPGLATATLEVNATGAWIENAQLEDNSAVGVQLYFVDSSTVFTNLSINNTGGEGEGANGAGISVRSSYFAPTFDGLIVSNSTSAGVFAINGGAIQGSDWNLNNNGQEGFYLESAATIVDGLQLSNNADSGVHIDDARYVFLSNLSSVENGDAGLEFNRANDIESASGDVSCYNCTSINNSRGLVAIDSVDLHLENLRIENPSNGPAIMINNSGLNIGVQGGMFHMENVETWINRTGPAIEVSGAEGEINGLDMFGNHGGLSWDADHNVERISILSNANLSGTGCLSLSNHDQLSGHSNSITADCLGNLSFVNVELNWTGLTDHGNHLFNVDTNSHLHFHKPNNIDYQNASIAGNGWIEESWDIEVWVVNNNSNGIPSASVQLNFDQLESSIGESTNEIGTVLFPDLRGKRYNSAGQTPFTTITVDCSYDGVSNSTTVILSQDRIVWCHLPLGNQAPFIMWDTPVDLEVFPSQSEVVFNASRSWDLDDDLMTFTWSSSIDGILLSGLDSSFTVNKIDEQSISLSDGIHDLTLEICDDKGNCITETRTIELSNQPPVIVVTTIPGLTPWGELITPITKPVEFSMNGTYDPENDQLSCYWSWLGNTQPIQNCTNGTESIYFSNEFINSFDLTLTVSDGVNSPREWVVPVELYNEVPTASFEIVRSGNYSQDQVTLISTTIDPEGDDITYLWESSKDGILSNESSWQGYLSRGSHVISLSVNDGRMEHINMTNVETRILVVENSPPTAVIESPKSDVVYDSSHLFEFNASGSGDYDSACTTFPPGVDWHCSDFEPASGSEYLIYTWESDIDGILQEDDTDWLIFEGYLTSGVHTITLTMDDGINIPVTTSVVVDVAQSAPVLEITKPDLSRGYHSSDLIEVDITQSTDYDGDSFTFNLTSDISGVLLSEANPSQTHQINLEAGEHTLMFTLIDDTGLERISEVIIIVVESDPEAVIYEPQNNQFYAPGELIILDSNGTSDSDNDITRREWRLHEKGEIYPTVLSNSAFMTTNLEPGVHHISLYVEDRRGGIDEVHLNITVASSNPDLSNLTVSPNFIPVDELTKIIVSVILDDPDGTTDNITAVITKNTQTWSFNLSDGNNDGVWVGEIDVISKESGKAQLKVTAVDGEKIDFASIDIDFVEEETDTFSTYAILGGIGAMLLLVSVVPWIIIRRRKRLADIELIDSWGVFGEEGKEYDEQEI